MTEPLFSEEPADAKEFAQRFDKTYTRIAGAYDLAVRLLPFWKTWLEAALPHIKGRRVLEVSFGTGYLLTRYPSLYDVHGIDLNARMVAVARKNLKRAGVSALLQQGSVLDLPYRSGCFDTVVNTMAFSGYPSAERAMAEKRRVLKAGGRLVLIDINFPVDRNRIGMMLTRCWQRAGDIIRDVDSVLRDHGFAYQDVAIGGSGSVHLYVCDKV
jgi:ubiquinone/menaquinone biosynthesis C-methylase UbiE